MTESILGFILLCFAVAIVFLGNTGLHIACWGTAALIAIVVAVIVMDRRAV